ncbi:MAG: hypothetical protein LCH63_07185 [Candidatus Melainabacteria bacterium]|uniref:Zinc ribbon domain-containing protein n=1 Tax=Candidatus Obscuribacter phosphatis TaxID=1906157 RepID=A0A8J7P713_9BACT|nr:hypothetical protein [Candidatus Obscuribacter phosphatis]MCA0313611.1 hypothetical protein [Candidatus Melainabacteria bacterium]
MSGSCPYCGAKLNYGIKFCVVCGRPIQGGDVGRIGGGMKTGIRPADVTRRLEDLMTAARFKRSKRQVNLDQQVHFFSLNVFSIVTGVALLFCAVKLSLDGGFITKENKMVAPITKMLTDMGADKVNLKNGTFAGGKAEDKSATDKKNADKKATEKKTTAQSSKKTRSSKKSKKKAVKKNTAE